MTTYTELVTQIRDYTETDSNVLSSTIINDFIEHTENRILRDLDIPIFTSHQYSNFTTSSGFLTFKINPVIWDSISKILFAFSRGTKASNLSYSGKSV